MDTIQMLESLEKFNKLDVYRYGSHYTGFRWVVIISYEKAPEIADQYYLYGHLSKVIMIFNINPKIRFHYELNKVLMDIIEQLPIKQKLKMFKSSYSWDGRIRKHKRYKVMCEYNSLPKDICQTSIKPYRPLTMHSGVATPGADYTTIEGSKLEKFIAQYWAIIESIKEI